MKASIMCFDCGKNFGVSKVQLYRFATPEPTRVYIDRKSKMQLVKVRE
jgi:hypothetical protein